MHLWFSPCNWRPLCLRVWQWGWSSAACLSEVVHTSWLRKTKLMRQQQTETRNYLFIFTLTHSSITNKRGEEILSLKHSKLTLKRTVSEPFVNETGVSKGWEEIDENDSSGYHPEISSSRDHNHNWGWYCRSERVTGVGWWCVSDVSGLLTTHNSVSDSLTDTRTHNLLCSWYSLIKSYHWRLPSKTIVNL